MLSIIIILSDQYTKYIININHRSLINNDFIFWSIDYVKNYGAAFNMFSGSRIFLSTLRLVKEYRDSIFKEIKLNRSGKVYYYTEASFPDINDSRIDGLIIVVIKGVIVDAAFFEMKNKNNGVEKAQIESYIEISKKLKVTKLVTISNEFVSDSTMSPIDVKVPKSISLFHFNFSKIQKIQNPKSKLKQKGGETARCLRCLSRCNIILREYCGLFMHSNQALLQ